MKTYVKVSKKLVIGLVAGSLPLLAGCPDMGSKSRYWGQTGGYGNSEVIVVEHGSFQNPNTGDSSYPNTYNTGNTGNTGPGPRVGSTPQGGTSNTTSNTSKTGSGGSTQSTSPIKMPKIIDRN